MSSKKGLGGSYLRGYQTRVTPQTRPMPNSGQVMNDAGGYSFAVDRWERMERFLVLGSEGGSYYVGEDRLTAGCAAAVLECIAADGVRAVEMIHSVSVRGRAAKADPALFALALVFARGSDEAKREAGRMLPYIASTGSHLFTFLSFVEGHRGWGRALRRAVQGWYMERGPDRLAYQVVKYRQRAGWSHRDALRLAKPVGKYAPEVEPILRWITRGEAGDDVPQIIHDFARLQAATTAAEAARLIGESQFATWEMVPTELLADPSVWVALLPTMPLMAMTRNLGRMTAIGAIAPFSDTVRAVLDKLEGDSLRRARVHPISVLIALKTYAQGHGQKGGLNWKPVPAVTDALNGAFYGAFGCVKPTGKKLLLALDVSGSMGWTPVGCLSAAEVAAAMALVTARTETDYHILAFSNKLVDLPISPSMRLGQVLAVTAGMAFGGTDCALPMLEAERRRWPVDCFVVYTDSQTWYGWTHPAEALRAFREHVNPGAGSVVVATSSNGFTLADPKMRMLDVVGFDPTVPDVISQFAGGAL